MRHNYLDRYARLDSPLHRLPAGLKLGTALCIIVATVIMPMRITLYFVLAAALVIALLFASRLPVWFVILRLLILEPFVAGVAILALVQQGGTAVAARVLMKSNLCLATMILLSNTTPFSSLLGVLRTIHVPALLITVLSLLYRYVFVLIDQAERMSRARKSRTFVHHRTWRWRSAATLIGQMFIRSTERAERVYAAMTARGWR